jgi:hypothetical protein
MNATETWRQRVKILSYRDRDWLYQKYVQEQLSQGDIGKLCGVDHMTIMGWMKKYHIPARPAGGITLRGEKNYLWKGGRKGNGDGYIMVLSPGHPGANKQGYVYEHRLIVESHIGRYLESKETVHHLNGIKDDNRLDNLQLMSEGEHHSLHARTIPRVPGRGRFQRKEAAI